MSTLAIARVPLFNRQGERVAQTLVDEADLPLIEGGRWHVNSQGYVYGRKDGWRGSLHRFLMQPPPLMVVDHINRVRRDNRRVNLRIATPLENAQNIGSRGGTSLHRGVRFDKTMRRWCGQWTYDGRMYSTPTFATEAECIQAIEELRAVVLGECPDVNGILTRPKPGQQTHCQRGHAFDEANTLVRSTGWRNCRACARDNQRERSARRCAKNAGIPVAAEHKPEAVTA